MEEQTLADRQQITDALAPVAATIAAALDPTNLPLDEQCYALAISAVNFVVDRNAGIVNDPTQTEPVQCAARDALAYPNLLWALEALKFCFLRAHAG